MPEISLPNGIKRGLSFLSLISYKTSFNVTISIFSFGTSKPDVVWPKTTFVKRGNTPPKRIATLSITFWIELTDVVASNLISNLVTDGPTVYVST